ncbi:hypothetical protein Tco_0677439 [Tanacetum coccineum]|uniref:Reverse transcriptase domain-containing protein n=1 Tax=Tanacetum coccineum TaxID=301880 RepID=A0ABQ4XDB3_9ASTR
MGDKNPIRTLGDYSKPSHEGYRNTIELPVGNNVVPLQSDTIRMLEIGMNIFQQDPHHMGGSYYSFPCSILSTGKDRKTSHRYPVIPTTSRRISLRSMDLFQGLTPKSPSSWHQSLAPKSWALLEDLALYDNESWNNLRDFAKPVKAISLPQDVPSTSDRRLIELKNQVQRLMEAHIDPIQPTQVNKITPSCEICGGPHDTQYCMEDAEQAFIEYASLHNNKMTAKAVEEVESEEEFEEETEEEIKEEEEDNPEHFDTFPTMKELRVKGLKVFIENFTHECDFMVFEDTTSVIDHDLGSVIFEKPFVETIGLVYDMKEGTVMFEKDKEKIVFKMPHKMEMFKHIDFTDIKTDRIPPFVIKSDDDNNEKTHYSDSLDLGPEYKYDENVCRAIQSLKAMKARRNKGEVTFHAVIHKGNKLYNRMQEFFKENEKKIFSEARDGIRIYPDGVVIFDEKKLKNVSTTFASTNDELSNPGDENLIKENEIAQIFWIDTDIFHFETPLCKAFTKFSYLFKIDVDDKGIPWVDEKLWSENGEPTDNINHVCKPFHFKSGHAEWPTYNWKEDGYYNIGDLPGMIRVGNSIHYQDYEWYDALEDSDLNDEALNNKAILEESINVEEESSLFTKPEITIAQSLLRTINDNGAQKNDEWFENHEPIEDDDDDIEDLEDYLIQKDPPYYVNEDTKRSKERRCKLHGIPYVEPPTCKSEKFEELTEQDDEIDGVLIF